VLLRSPTLCPPELRAQRAVRDTTLRHGASGLVAASLEGNHVLTWRPNATIIPATGPVPVDRPLRGENEEIRHCPRPGRFGRCPCTGKIMPLLQAQIDKAVGTRYDATLAAPSRFGLRGLATWCNAQPCASDLALPALAS